MLKDDCQDFFHIEPDMIGKVAAEDYGLTFRCYKAEVPAPTRKVKVLFLPPYLTAPAVEEAKENLRRALERQMPKCEIVMIEVEPPFEEPMTGEYFWFAPYAKQASETKKRYRKQALAGIVTVLRAVGRFLPDFVVGIQQGGMIAALCSSPLLVETAARQRSATESEVTQLRTSWPGIRGILAVKPFVTVAHSTLERLLEAVPEADCGYRTLSCSLVAGHTATEKRFAEAVGECLGCRSIPADLVGLEWERLIDEPTLILPWQNEGCISCGKRAHLTRCDTCRRPLHLTCAVNRKLVGEPPRCMNCVAAMKELKLGDEEPKRGTLPPWLQKAGSPEEEESAPEDRGRDPGPRGRSDRGTDRGPG